MWMRVCVRAEDVDKRKKRGVTRRSCKQQGGGLSVLSLSLSLSLSPLRARAGRGRRL